MAVTKWDAKYSVLGVVNWARANITPPHSAGITPRDLIPLRLAITPWNATAFRRINCGAPITFLTIFDQRQLCHSLEAEQTISHINFSALHLRSRRPSSHAAGCRFTTDSHGLPSPVHKAGEYSCALCRTVTDRHRMSLQWHHLQWPASCPPLSRPGDSQRPMPAHFGPYHHSRRSLTVPRPLVPIQL